jgi:CBS domain containing-hemolysin-like protein
VVCVGVVLDAWLTSWWAVLGVTAAGMGIVLFILVGVAPGTLGRQHPEWVALSAAPTAARITRFLGPVARLLVLLGNAVTPGKGYPQGPFASEEELRDLVDIASEAQEIHAGERRMIHSVFELGDTIVREVMVPRTDVLFLPRGTPLEQARGVFTASGFSRIPVIGEDVDDPIGVAFFKDVVAHLDAPDSARTVESVMREAVWVPESQTVDSLLRQMQRDHSHVALVVDEYGGTAGLVTIEDLVEEIVGEIADEHDAESPGVEEVGHGVFRVPARLAIADLEELFDVEFEDETVDTVGGLLAKEVGGMPILGSASQVGPIRLTAERRGGRRNRVTTLLAERVATDRLAGGLGDSAP